MATLSAVSGYGQFCPVAKAAEVFAERWTPLILRELLCGSTHFGELQRGLPRISHSLLSERLRSLEAAGLIISRPKSEGRGRTYHLSPAGEEMRPLVEGLGRWGQRWTNQRVDEADHDPGLLMWDIHRSLDRERLPASRTCIEFEFSDRAQRWWIVCKGLDVELCRAYPGFAADLVVGCDLPTMTRIWLGRETLGSARAGGRLWLRGDAAMVTSFPDWFVLSSFAPFASTGS